MAKRVEKFAVRNRWTGAIQFTAEINCGATLRPKLKLGLAIKWAYERDADLRGADLRDADLRDADLRGADLGGAYLSGAYLRDAPVIPDIHKAVYAAATAPDAKFDMSDWHGGGNFCGTTHCRAGWVTHLAGDAGRELERRAGGTAEAATLIYLASDPKLERVPNFYCGNAEALADMKRLAEQAS
jgi:hypothetical protein